MKAISLTPRQVGRIFAKVDCSPGQGPGGDCWEWIGYRTPSGYGETHLGSEYGGVRIHRAVMSIVANVSGIVVAHHCDNPPCVRISHLFCTDQAGNWADMRAKGRARGGSMPGESHPNAVLTEEQVREIRWAAGDGEVPQRIADRYGISRTMVRNIVAHTAWRHVV